jgi:Rieske Fe-S protein
LHPNILKPGETKTRAAPFWPRPARRACCYTAALAYPIYRYLASPEEMALNATAVTEVTLKDAQKLPAGSVLMFKFGTAPAMLIHHEDGRWVALTAVCTHLGCTVQYEPQADRIHCACHGGVYNPTPAPTSADRRPSRSSSSKSPSTTPAWKSRAPDRNCPL